MVRPRGGTGAGGNGRGNKAVIHLIQDSPPASSRAVHAADLAYLRRRIGGTALSASGGRQPPKPSAPTRRRFMSNGEFHKVYPKSQEFERTGGGQRTPEVRSARESGHKSQYISHTDASYSFEKPTSAHMV